LADVIRQVSRLKYGKERAIVENEVKLRGAFIKKVQKPQQNDFMGGLGNFGGI
jgi:hypothetical protein